MILEGFISNYLRKSTGWDGCFGLIVLKGMLIKVNNVTFRMLCPLFLHDEQVEKLSDPGADDQQHSPAADAAAVLAQ